MWTAQSKYQSKSYIYTSFSPSSSINWFILVETSNLTSQSLAPRTAVQEPQRIQNMDRTVLRSAMIMQPEDRNRHNFMIFGGFLLQQTFELAFCCAASFSHTRPTFVSLDPSTFENPVPVGSVLYLSATVAYTESLIRTDNQDNINRTTPYTKVHVRVDSKVRDVEHATKKSTGVFHYTFLVPNEVQVMPTKYAEYMVWLDARRRAHDLDPIIASRFTEDSASARMDGVTE
jgi:acyl-coenzyme A thioesterase 9